MKVRFVLFLLLSSIFGSEQDGAAKPVWRPEFDSLLLMEDSSVVNWPQAIRFISSASADPNSELAIRTVRTLGIIGDTLTAEMLVPLLKFRDYPIACEAAFALGQMGDQKARAALEEAASGPPELAARAAEALTKLADSTSLGVIEKLFSHADPKVRYAAAVSTWKFKSKRLTQKLVGLLADSVPEVRFGAAWSLARFPDSAAIPVLQKSIHDPDDYVRAQVVRPLGALKVREASAEVAGRVQSDSDWKVRVNACRALAAIGASGQAPILRTVLGDELERSKPNYHLIIEAALAIGTLKDSEGLALIRRLGRRSEIFLRGWAATALGSYKSSDVVKDLTNLAADPEWRVRAKAAEGLGAVLRPEAFEALTKLLSDPDYRVRYAALGGLGEYKDKNLRAYVRTGLADSDFAMVATACEITAARKDSSLLSDILADYRKNIQARETDFKLSYLDAAQALADSGAVIKTDARLDSLLTLGLADPDRLIRKKAIQLGKALERDYSYRLGAFPPQIELDSTLEFVHKLQEYRVFVTLATERGEVTIELLGERAPRTAANFWRLCQNGYFSGRAFHRVVPNFVVQDGCNRGDGWGGPGYTIRCEYNDLTYERGTVGMALSGKDTGGSQFFICHAPQPHLDGRYTIFGRVTSGMDVVDQLQVGDSYQIKSIALQKIE